MRKSSATWRHERVELIVNNARSEKRARKILEAAPMPSADNIRLPSLADQPRLDPRQRLHLRRRWTDVGIPSAVEYRVEARPIRTPITWRFNAWAKYPNYRHDEKIGSLMARPRTQTEIARPAHRQHPRRPRRRLHRRQRTRHPAHHRRMPAEQVQQRNPGMSARRLRADFRRLSRHPPGNLAGHGIAGDDTHGHVDDITRFVSPDTIVTVVESEPERREPRAAAGKSSPPEGGDRSGRQAASQIVELPMPAPGDFRRPPPARQLRATSTSPTAWCWSRCSTIPMTASRSTFWPSSSLIAKSSHLFRRPDLGLRRACTA